MKRLVNTLLFLTLLVLPSAAQDFKLYYAKNVTDVTDFSNTTVIARQLSWREVKDGAIDGNLDDVTKVKAMLASTRMKGLEDQQLFWKMRDEMLLCFRIEDTTGGSSSFRVELNYGKDEDGKEKTKTLTTSRYFFANMPLACDSVNIEVWRVKDPTQRIRFRYWIYDWDDANVYIFQLDQKRQSTGDTYKMEYVTSKMDEEGEIQNETTTLELKETKFQSFYVPEDRTLTAVYFLTGNKEEGDVKMQLDMEDIHPNIDISHQLEIPYLSTKFNLAKHEYREMMNFNWLGTGLFEKYDTLYVKLFNEYGQTVTDASMNVHRVDEEGNLVNDNSLRYLGYDENMGQHKVLTYGHPAYVEILVDDYLPLVYRYKGAADAETKEVSADLCSAKITLKPGNPDDGGIAISDQYFHYLKDEHVAVTRGETDYTIVTIDVDDISGKIPSEKVVFMDDGGVEYPKLLNNKPIEKFANLEVVFSSPKDGMSPQCNLTVTEVNSKKTHEAQALETRVVSASQFKHFTRDYYFTRYDMANALPKNLECRLKLSTATSTYDKFPIFVNGKSNMDDAKKKADEQTKKNTSPKDERENCIGGMDNSGLGFKLPIDAKFSFGDHLTIKTGGATDFTKQTCNFYTSITYSGNIKSKDKDKEKELKGARANAKQIANYKYKKIEEKGEGKDKRSTSISMTDTKLKFDDWVLNEMEDIFSVSALHVGWYVSGSGKIAVKMPLLDMIKLDFSRTQIEEASATFEGGYGLFFTPDAMSGAMKDAVDGLDFIGLKPDIGMVLDANLRFDLGVKSFDSKMESSMSSDNMAFFANAGFTARIGAWLGAKTPDCFLGNLNVGLRAGGKFNLTGGLVVPFNDEPLCYGGRLMILGGVEAFVDIRTFIFNYSARVAFRAGYQLLFPDDNTNPFHSKFPYWLNSSKTRTIGNSFKPMIIPEASSLGQPIVTNVFYDANPHFLDGNRIVYNDLGAPDDYNDDHVSLATLTTNDESAEGAAAVASPVSTTSLSVSGTSAGQHARSKRGEPEIVVYQQTSRNVDNASINDETAGTLDILMQQHTQIKASILQPDGSWLQTVVTPDDGFTDQKPVVTMQDSGKAAVIYEHGTIKFIDETVSADSVYNRQLEGQLLLRYYTPSVGWSEPTALFDINKTTRPVQYDLIMRDDSVLVGALISDANDPLIGTFAAHRFRYASVALPVPNSGRTEPTVNYVDEDLHPVNFFMNRVGIHGVNAMLYEKPDSTREIYIKTLYMSGKSDGVAGCDLGVGGCRPDRVKIICDRSADFSDDFAVLWTEQSNIVRDAENGSKGMKDIVTMLNATRIHLSETPRLTYPLTVGAERDSLLMTDFDGFLDDDHIEVVYALSDVKNGTAVIMYNEKEFTNSFESDVTYSREALLGSSSLPVNVKIRNTGTSAINAATVTINGQVIDIAEAFIPPMSQKTFVVQYPIPEDFDGYMESSVEVQYANLFKARMQKGRRAMARNLMRQFKSFSRERVSAGDIDCNIVSRSVDNGINIFVVEIIDRSSRGLTPGTGVMVGAYPHPSATVTLTDQAEGLVHPEDFHQMGGVRKAYTEIYVAGIAEPVDAYIVPHIVDLEADEEGYECIANVRSGSNASFVTLHPTGTATDIDDQEEIVAKDHRVSVSIQDGGVLLGNLEPGEDVRIFNSAGLTMLKKNATSNTLFVPLQRHDTYVISAGQEVFKFIF